MLGSSISHYKIVEKLGEGGMGEVFKAEDTKLERTVALKFLAPHLLNDAEAKQRFLREAKAAASLDHPNICTVYEIAEADGKAFLAMAFLKGETLEDRIAQGPLAIKDALEIGRQVAEGLQAAHSEGVVHRDIKPANILISPDGRATIMDFGLARLTEASRLTKAEQTVGTAAYMSPEQMQGGDVDHRTDIWALGCVLYEMVAGVRPFKGEYHQALAYEIVGEDPEPLTGVRTGVPMELEFIVAKCLAKDREDRPASGQEVARELRTLTDKLKSGKSTVLSAASVAAGTPPSLAPDHSANVVDALPEGNIAVRRSRWSALTAAVAVLGALLLSVVIYQFSNRSSEPPAGPLVKFSIPLPDVDNPSISPNGRYVAYESEGKLWLRDLRQLEPSVLHQQEGRRWLLGGSFWSPDSAFVGFYAGGRLWKIAITGGVPIALCDVEGEVFAGAAWRPDGRAIVFSTGLELQEVSSDGGAPKTLLSAERDLETRFVFDPLFVRSQERRLLAFRIGPRRNRRLLVRDLDSGETKEIHRRVGSTSYSTDAGFVYAAGVFPATVWKLGFSPETMEKIGEPVPIAQTAREPTVSETGVLAYLTDRTALRQIAWVDRRGFKAKDLGGAHEFIVDPALSPDGRSVAVSARENGGIDIWIYDIARGARTRLTSAENVEFRPVWSPTGDELLFQGVFEGEGERSILKRRSDGGGQIEQVSGEGLPAVSDWSRDGRYIVYERSGEETENDLWYAERATGGAWESKPFLQTPFSERGAKLSPNGRFIAYSSDESGDYEIYVQPFPEGGRRVTVSSRGGEQVRWSRDGTELFYVEDLTLVAVEVSTRAHFTAGAATRLFDHNSFGRSHYPQYDVTADGQEFVIVAPWTEDGDQPKLNVVLNWQEELRDQE